MLQKSSIVLNDFYFPTGRCKSSTENGIGVNQNLFHKKSYKIRVSILYTQKILSLINRFQL